MSAPGKKPWQRLILIGAEADKQTLMIPMLEDGPAEPSPPPGAGAPPHTPASSGQPGPGPRRDELAERPIPISVYIGAGVTAALGVGAGVSGITYLREREAFQDAQARGATNDLSHDRKTAQDIGYLNLGLWIGTACAAGVTTYLYVTRPKAAPAAQLVPVISHQSAGLTIVGGF